MWNWFFPRAAPKLLYQEGCCTDRPTRPSSYLDPEISTASIQMEDEGTREGLGNGTQESNPESVVEELASLAGNIPELKARLLRVIEELFRLRERVSELESGSSDGFCIDSVPLEAEEQTSTPDDINYHQPDGLSIMSSESDRNPAVVEDSGPSIGSGSSCFNCRGDHLISDCPEPKDSRRIAKGRREFQSRSGLNTSRYHVDELQKFGHLRPGLPSKKLKKALGLRDGCLPSYIYRMRRLGYPPAWLKSAKIDPSGLSLYMTKGKVINSNDARNGEEGEVGNEETQFDVKKLQEWPGFNVDPPSHYKEEAKYFGCPLMKAEDSLELMKKKLGQFAQKAYVRGEMENTNVEKEHKVEVTPFREVSDSVVKTINTGTPICSTYSPYSKLPDSSKWTTNTTDHIFFENLPEATGHFERFKKVLNKVKKKRLAQDFENSETPGSADSLLSPDSPEI